MIIKENFTYSPNGSNRMLHIYLPDDYYDSDESYPVMYFFDGHNLFYDEDATYGKSWGLKTFLDQWDKKMIIVGMECSHVGQERLSEYLPYPAIRKPFSQFDVQGDATFKWIVEEIKPYIDQTYRTIPFRECCGIAGSSMGGLMAFYGVSAYNEVFSKAACISSSINICMPAIQKQLDKQTMNPDTRIFMSWGTREVKDLKDIHHIDTTSMTYARHYQILEYADEQDANMQMYCQVEGGHCEADWEKLVPYFMQYLWQS